jgi:ParB family chromosome partitioning protein
MTELAHNLPENGDVLSVALSRLKPSPRNARRTPHRTADIETLAASIAAKGLLQPLVVEPARDEHGVETGDYLVTIGEGRRQALTLLAARKAIGKKAAVRCILDVANDAHEISLDENVTRFAMHPADQFEAFRAIAEARGFGPEEIGARFGVTPAVVRQRLKLAVVSPALMAVYRADGMTLDQLMAFTLTEDHARQEAVWETLSWNKDPAAIRRALLEGRVRATDKRVKFLGMDAYLAAGGPVERDLFADDGGGYLADPVLLDQLVMARLREVADQQLADGWKWAEAAVELPPIHNVGRVYPALRELSVEEEALRQALSEECDTLLQSGDEDDAVGERLDAISAELATLEAARRVYEPEAKSRAGVLVALDRDGAIRLEAGFVRAEDVAPECPEQEVEQGECRAERPQAGLSDKLIGDLTAHRSAALTDALGGSPDVALAALVHALALRTFGIGGASCLEVQIRPPSLGNYAADIQDSIAWRQTDARHAAWAERLPSDGESLWSVVRAMPQAEQLALLAHCIGFAVNAVQPSERRTSVRAHSDLIAEALGLDMAAYWAPTVGSYLGRVSKARILEAVREGVSDEAASQIEGLKKQPMAETAEARLAGRNWLPALLRAPAADTVI